MTEEGVGQVMVDLMLAGTETTATTLMWFNLYMVHYPEVQKKVSYGNTKTHYYKIFFWGVRV